MYRFVCERRERAVTGNVARHLRNTERRRVWLVLIGNVTALFLVDVMKMFTRVKLKVPWSSTYQTSGIRHHGARP